MFSFNVEARTQLEANFRPDISSLSTWLTGDRPRLVWLCNPNNPTGSCLELPDLVHLAKICGEINVLLVIDEAYYHFVFVCNTNGTSHSAVQLLSTEFQSHVLILRSLTKDYALAGLRLGYAVGLPKVIQPVGAQLPSWNVNGLAQGAGCAALADRDHLRMTLARLAEGRQIFFKH